MGYYNSHPATSYNGICIWLQTFDHVRSKPAEEKLKYINSMIRGFIKANGENVRFDKDGSYNIEKSSNLISTRWERFKNYCLEKEEFKNE